MEDNTLVHQKIDTTLNADSVEFCPFEGQQDILLCGTYQLQESSNSEPGSDDLDGVPSPPASQTRLGGVTVYSLSHDKDTGKPRLCYKNQLHMYGVLDIKWQGRRFKDKSLFGLVDAEGLFQIFNLADVESPPVLVNKLQLSESSLGLSLGWDGGNDRQCTKAICSDSKGCLNLFTVDNDGVSFVTRWLTHDYEAWITSFHDFDSNIVYSGGDDCTLKGWDLRDTTKPTFISRRHSMGVCSIQSHPFDENIYATGSYDEELVIWDRRRQRHPLADIKLNGGIWRIKWDPFSGRYILTATMYNGTHIVDCDYSGDNSLQVLAEHGDHNLAYGADWCRLDKDLKSIKVRSNEDNHFTDPSSFLISTCSFYDHSLHLWEWEPNCKRIKEK